MKKTPQDALDLMRQSCATLEDARAIVKTHEHWGFYADDLTWIMGHLQALIESIAEQTTPRGI